MDRQEKYIENLQRMIRLETISDPRKCSPWENFEKFHELMWELFPHIREACELKDFNGSLLLKWKGSDENKLPVMFMNHHDVVPASPEGWKYPPFSAEVAEGKLWGRGTLDDKGGLWAMLQAADELAAEGFAPPGDIYFETACNEETFGAGAREISAWMADNDIRLEMVFDEGGEAVINPINGTNGTIGMVGVGEKSVVNMKFIARSEGGHASTPGRNTPLVRLGKFMNYVERHRVFDVELSPTVTEMFVRMAPYMGNTGKLLGNAEKMKKPLEILLPNFGGTVNAMLTTTIAFTMAGGGEAPNVIPREAWVIGDMRCSHHQGQAASIEAITRVAKKFDLDVEITELGVETQITDFGCKAFRLVEEAVRETMPGVDVCTPYIMTGGSDSRYFCKVCDQVVRFQPFTIDTDQMESVHGINECVDIAALVPAVDFFRYMIQHV